MWVDDAVFSGEIVNKGIYVFWTLDFDRLHLTVVSLTYIKLVLQDRWNFWNRAFISIRSYLWLDLVILRN